MDFYPRPAGRAAGVRTLPRRQRHVARGGVPGRRSRLRDGDPAARIRRAIQDRRVPRRQPSAPAPGLPLVHVADWMAERGLIDRRPATRRGGRHSRDAGSAACATRTRRSAGPATRSRSTEFPDEDRRSCLAARRTRESSRGPSNRRRPWCPELTSTANGRTCAIASGDVVGRRGLPPGSPASATPRRSWR